MRFRPGAQSVRIGLGMVVTSCAVAACAPAPDRARHDVAFYRQNAEERERALSVCANDPGALAVQPECINAREAARIEGIGSLQHLPPMELPAPATPAQQQ
jgi:hypothetical protein